MAVQRIRRSVFEAVYSKTFYLLVSVIKVKVHLIELYFYNPSSVHLRGLGKMLHRTLNSLLAVTGIVSQLPAGYFCLFVHAEV